jgi:hypothetical protein
MNTQALLRGGPYEGALYWLMKEMARSAGNGLLR